jgi:hypothetical protein
LQFDLTTLGFAKNRTNILLYLFFSLRKKKVPLVKVHFHVFESTKDPCIYLFVADIFKRNSIYTKKLYLSIMYVIEYLNLRGL